MLKKQLIMEKALELFAEQGFEATSVQQITERCGISKGAFYLSFKSKDELIISLIDHFMTQIVTEIDYKVRTIGNESLLYDFYYSSFHALSKYSNFAKLFIKEQTHTLNEELLSKLHGYNQLQDKTILSMVERLYGNSVEHSKYDLVYCIKGFIQTYLPLLLFTNISLDLVALAKSLTEKTEILAKHVTIPFITTELIQIINQPLEEQFSEEQIIEMIDRNLEEMEESIEKESLLLLKEELVEPKLGRALTKGLLENIRNNPHCKWTSFILRNYFNI